MGFIQRFAFHHALDQIAVLQDITAGAFGGVLALFAADLDPCARVGSALGADDKLADVVIALWPVTAHAHDTAAVGVFVLDREMVPDLPGILADLPAAHAVGADRVRAHDPIGHIQVVDVLLVDLVSAEPDIVVPIVDLVLDVRHARLAGARPDAGGVPIDTHVDHVADHAVVNLADGVGVVDLV